MNMRDLIPWGRGNNESQASTVYRDSEQHPFLSLHREVNRLFDDVFREFDTRLPTFGRLSSFRSAWPSVEISDKEDQITVTAEVPGLEEKDIEVLLDDGVLTLRGEKRSETDERDVSSRSAITASAFPTLHLFLDFWCREIEGALHSVLVAHNRLIQPSEFRAVKGIITFH